MLCGDSDLQGVLPLFDTWKWVFLLLSSGFISQRLAHFLPNFPFKVGKEAKAEKKYIFTVAMDHFLYPVSKCKNTLGSSSELESQDQIHLFLCSHQAIFLSFSQPGELVSLLGPSGESMMTADDAIVKKKVSLKTIPI